MVSLSGDGFSRFFQQLVSVSGDVFPQLVWQVAPLSGDVVKVDTRTKDYVERVKK
jgi:hypothetical protein